MDIRGQSKNPLQAPESYYADPELLYLPSTGEALVRNTARRYQVSHSNMQPLDRICVM